jgi:hypothetical protein
VQREEAEKYILENVKVTRQKIAIAQSHILGYLNTDEASRVGNLIESFLRSKDAEWQEKEIVFHPEADPLPRLNEAINPLSWEIAIREAIWGLIGTAAIFQHGGSYIDMKGSISCGSGKGISIEELRVKVPSKLKRSRSRDLTTYQPLSNPDLYMKELDIHKLHPGIEHKPSERL